MAVFLTLSTENDLNAFYWYTSTTKTKTVETVFPNRTRPKQNACYITVSATPGTCITGDMNRTTVWMYYLEGKLFFHYIFIYYVLFPRECTGPCHRFPQYTDSKSNVQNNM